MGNVACLTTTAVVMVLMRATVCVCLLPLKRLAVVANTFEETQQFVIVIPQHALLSQYSVEYLLSTSQVLKSPLFCMHRKSSRFSYYTGFKCFHRLFCH